MTTATRALAKGAWRERLNQSWRFSRGKVGLWPMLLQVGLATLLLWRLKPSPTAEPLIIPVATAAVLGLFGSFVLGLLAGREDLYGKSVLRALHVSPVSGVSILNGLILAGLPQRLFGSLLVAAVTGWLMPAGGLWWSIPLLWGVTMLSSLVGYASALLALVGWVRVHPKSLAIMWGLAVMIGLTIVVILIGVVTLALPVSVIAAGLRAGSHWLIGGAVAMGALVGLPGLVMLVWVVRRPQRVGEWYREAYLNMQELGDGRRLLRTSRWPRVLPGPAGALQARLWLEAWLNWFTWVRLVMMVVGFGFFFAGRTNIARLADSFPTAVILGLGLTMTVGSFGELPATMGSSDGPNIGLGLVAGVRANQVIRAKWVACLPMAVLSVAATWVSSVLVGRPDLVLSLAGGCIGLGFSAIAIAGGLMDLDPSTEVTERDVPEILRAALEQVPRKMGGVIGYFGAVLFTVATGWLCARTPGTALPTAVGCTALAHLALLWGYLHLRRLGI